MMDLTEIKALEAAASGGPWIEGLFRVNIPSGYAADDFANNRRFIVAAREWVPKLIAEVERLRGFMTCVFCGHECQKPATVAEALRVMAVHVVECEKHPLRAAVRENARLQARLAHLEELIAEANS